MINARIVKAPTLWSLTRKKVHESALSAVVFKRWASLIKLLSIETILLSLVVAILTLIEFIK